MPKKSIVIAHGGDLSDATGGTNRIITFAKSLSDNGFDTHLVIPKPKGKLPVHLNGVKLHIVPIKEKGVRNQIIRALFVSYKAKTLSKKYNAILQIELSTLAGVANLLGCSGFILDVNDISIGDPQYSSLPLSALVKRFIYDMERRAVLNASRIIVVSSSMKRFIMTEWNIPEDKIEVIPNGFFESEIENLEINSYIDEKMIVTLGTLFDHLDVDKIIELGKSVQSNGIKIYLVGDGILRSYLQQRILDEKLDNVFITGWLPYSEAMRFMSRSMLAFHTIKRSLTTEVACPVKILDYAAMGKPMVLSDVSELSEILKKMNLALVSDPDNPNEFRKNVEYLINDKNLREKMSLGLKKFANDFTWNKQGNKLVQLIGNLEA